MAKGYRGPEAAVLVSRARKAAHHAYAPYSGFKVGAAVVDERGRVFTGANVENASFGLTSCAERVAIFSAIASGAKRITAVAVTSTTKRPVSPCGACRQVMAEFAAADTPVHLDAGRGKRLTHTVAQLLPGAFDSAALPAKRRRA